VVCEKEAFYNNYMRLRRYVSVEGVTMI